MSETTYTDIIETCSAEGITFEDIDHILVNEETLDVFREKMATTNDVETSDYETISGPAVRETDGTEKIVYVAPDGTECSVEL